LIKIALTFAYGALLQLATRIENVRLPTHGSHSFLVITGPGLWENR
jgi:hypothetical protein